jgi:Undecaprenyl-phosphate glucose phosphotransferase
MRDTPHSPALRIMLLDIVLLSLCNAFFVIDVKGYTFGKTAIGERYLVLLILLNLLWIITNLVVSHYKLEVNKGYIEEITKIFLNMILFTGIVSVIAFTFKELKYSRIVIYGTLAAFFFMLMLSHLLVLKLILHWRRKNPIKKQVLVVGNDRSSIDLANILLKEKDIAYNVLVYIETEELDIKVDSTLIVGKLKDAKTIFEGHKIDELFIAVSSSDEDEIKQLVEIADYHGARVRMVPTFFKLFERNFQVNLFSNIPIINVNDIPLDNYYSALYKRVFDILFSLINLVILSPLLLLIALLIKLTSRGPVIYVPKRVGVDGNVFKLFKFRTMYFTPRVHENLSTQENDARITPLGRLLRRFNLDELPQFVNVLMSDMSVVGPRPHRMYLEKVMQNSVDKYMVRHYVKPGITGWAQVNGWRGPTETEEQKVQRTKHDLWYIKNWSFWLDIKIIFLTLIGKKSRVNAF